MEGAPNLPSNRSVAELVFEMDCKIEDGANPVEKKEVGTQTVARVTMIFRRRRERSTQCTAVEGQQAT